MTSKIEDLVDYFFGDANVQRLVTSTATWEPLQICYPKEVNISRFIAWLLDPTEGHGLSDLAIQSLLIRAWWQSDAADLDVATRRLLSPGNVQTEGFSSCVVTTEVSLGGRSLDVLVLDANRRRYIAIENKFGANQSKSQHKHYREHLKALLPSFLGVHIFLDSNEAEPEDSAWIPVGYDWLADFLREAEKREATAHHVRDALAQFRRVIEDEAEDSMGKTTYGRLVTAVAGDHPEVMRLMATWSNTCVKGTRALTLAELMKQATTLEGKATLRLFQLYWRRTAVWEDCIRQVQFAPFVSALRDRFDDLSVDPKRIRTAFSLQQWASLVEHDRFEHWYYPAGVNVWRGDQTFNVTTFIQLNDVCPEKREALIEVAEEMRKANGVKVRMKDEQAFVVLRRRKGLTQDHAVKEVEFQLAELQGRLSAIR